MAKVRKHIYFSGQVQGVDSVIVQPMQREPMALPDGWIICGTQSRDGGTGRAFPRLEEMIQEIQSGALSA